MQVVKRTRASFWGGRLVLLLCLIAVAWTVGGEATADEQPGDELGIFVMQVDTGQERKLAQIDGYQKHWTPRWSHSGQRLVFDVNAGPDNVRKVYVVDADGTSLREIGEGSAAEWSPDDQKLLLQSDGNNVRAGLWLHNLRTGSRDWVAEGACPRWSPDGTRIAYRADRGIRYIDLNTNEDRPLVEASTTHCMAGFDWSRDSRRIGFFGKQRDLESTGLYLIDVGAVGGQPQLRLEHGGFWGGHLSFSPDDRQIVFTVESFLHVMDVAGETPPRRLPGQPHKCRDPHWSPDGKSIAFARRRFGER